VEQSVMAARFADFILSKGQSLLVVIPSGKGKSRIIAVTA